jgi:hypothetical protein
MIRLIGNILAFTLCLASVHAWGQPVTGGAADLAKQLQELERLVKRLHGYKAAVLAHEFESTAPGSGHFRVGLIVCPGIELGMVNSCWRNAPDAVMLTTRPLTAADDRAILRFDATNHPEFATMIDLLTNGSEDRVSMFAEFRDDQDNLIVANGIRTTEFNRFFIGPQVSSGPGYVDLAGFEIDHIDVSIDRMRVEYDQGDDETDFTLRFRVFFGLAE